MCGVDEGGITEVSPGPKFDFQIVLLLLLQRHWRDPFSLLILMLTLVPILCSLSLSRSLAALLRLPRLRGTSKERRTGAFLSTYEGLFFYGQYTYQRVTLFSICSLVNHCQDQ